MTHDDGACGPIRSIAIVGGGTAGWLSATYLQRALRGEVGITLVESDSVPPIGVGESTLPTLRPTMAFLGLDDEDWMPEVDATYKVGIRFVDWSAGQSVDGGREFWHPFIDRSRPPVLPYSHPYYAQIGQGFGIEHYALRRRLDGGPAMAEQLSLAPALCRAKRDPRLGQERQRVLPLAYHVDAGRLGQLLRRTATERGVEHRLGDVVDVVRREDGHVKQVVLTSGETIAADLFVDCSGFTGLLIQRGLGQPFDSYGKHLLCDRAIALQARTDPQRDGLEACTTSTALQHGWSWRVPLRSRAGCGYVYCSDFTSDDAAEAELRGLLGPAADGLEARVLKMRVGKTRRLWAHNVVSIGLSGGFIEPLEATAIFLIEFGLANLVSLFPDRGPCEARARQYDRIMGDIYAELLDFIVLHYAGSGRRDTAFWRAASERGTLTDSLTERLQQLEVGLPVHDAHGVRLFQSYSWACLLDGLHMLPARPHPLLEQLGYTQGFEELDRMNTEHERLLQTLPDYHGRP